MYATHKKVPTQIFGTVWCPILRTETNSAAVLVRPKWIEQKKTELETEYKLHCR